MPIPLKPGEEVYIDYKELPGTYAMPKMEIALDHYAIGYNISGNRKYFTQAKVFYAHGKTIGFAEPNVYHRNMPVSDEPYHRYLIKYKKEVLQPVIDLIGENEFKALHAEYLKFTEESHALIRPQFDAMLTIYNSQEKYSQFILKNMLQNLVLTIYREKLPFRGGDIQLTSFNEQILKAMFYIEQNLAGDLSLNTVAASVSLSPSHFSRLFKNSVGVSFSDYVTDSRLQYAKVLLAKEHLSIGEIAERTGFNNSNYFSTTFKKHNNMTPKEYGAKK